MKTAIVTPSYAADFDRCALLCESIDARVDGYTTHFILVEPADVARFSVFKGPRRVIVDERAILPGWLRPFRDPLSPGRRIWLSLKGPPLRGWHVQQLRKIAIATILDEDGVLICDSDTAFIREANLDDLWQGDAFAFYALDGGIGAGMERHRDWSARAGRLLGIPGSSDTDYIAQSVTWRTDTIRAMTARIEAVSGRSWQAAVAARRQFSECMIYGRFVDEMEGRPGAHARTEMPLCRTQWTGAPMDEQGLRAFVAGAAAGQRLVGFQSFLSADVGAIRRSLGMA